MSGYHNLGAPHAPGGNSPSDEHRNPFANPYDDPHRQHRSPSPTLPRMTPLPQHQQARSPSPHQPLNPQSYQMQPLNRPLEIPTGPGPNGGRHSPLLAQPSVGAPVAFGAARPPANSSFQYSVENVSDPYGHHPANPYNDPYTAHNDGYHNDPHSHHDQYYDQHYDAHTPGSEIHPHYPPNEQPTHYWQDEQDTRPMLQPDTSYGPDPYQSAPSPVQEKPMGNGEYMTADGKPAPTPSPAPVKRWKTVKEIQLFRGNLVLDCPIPPRLLNQVPHVQPPERDEFTHMRYSAATCDPNDFYTEGFTLRQKLFAKPRHTELFIVVTMYNEEEELFARTMVGVIQNIEYMNSRTNSKTWGKEAWKKIVVCIVSDGRAKINPRTRAVIAALGCYQEGIAKQQVNGKDVTAHIYEYTTQMALEIKKNVVQVRKGNTPIQLLFCLKEKNQKKINSHRWFFQAFGSVLDPNICVLIDAGTKPGKHSIYQLWKAFDVEPMCAGACGEIKAMLEHGKKLLNPLVAAQNFEYKISNILDKPLESVFGFISVLPGAFSAYRYVALQNDKTGQGPLEKYFKGEKMHGADAGIFTANMYLAEDRILCFELVAKRNCHWILQYVKSAEGETDVPTEMADFIMQRRRWLNGSFFAAVYALVHFYQIFRSKHSCIRKMFFLVEFLYQTINQIFAWFAIGNFFLVFRILTTSLASDDMLGAAGRILAVVFEWLYLVTLVTCFVLALGNRPQGSNKFYMTMVYFWVILMVYLMFAAVFVIVKSVQKQLEKQTFSVSLLFTNQYFFSLVVSLCATYVLYLVMSILFFDPWHMFTSFIQYMLLTPTYTNILNVYAFCNTHDVTWGTKGDDKPPKLGSANIKPGGGVDVAIPDTEHDLNTQYEAELLAFNRKYEPPKKVAGPAEKQEDYYKGFRSAVVLVWMFCNLALCAVVLNTGGFDRLEDSDTTGASIKQNNNQVIYMTVVLWSVAVLAAFRFIGSFWFLVIRLLRGV